jgi:hypothetical protein
MWKEVVVAQFKVGLLSRHLPGETEEMYGILSPDSRSPDQDLRPWHPEHEAVCWPFDSDIRSYQWNNAVPQEADYYRLNPLTCSNSE